MNPNKTIGQILQYGKKVLQKENIETYALDAQLLLMKATGLSKVLLFTKDNESITKESEQAYFEMLSIRAKGCPTQYILGECEFMGLNFYVCEGVLVPRADTEILVETIIEYAKKENIDRAIDVGTGSGCIPIALAYYEKMNVCGVDISKKNIEIAKRNAVKNNVFVNFIESNLFDLVPKDFYKKCKAIISNPPYIPTNDIKSLMREVRDYEPRIALDGGADGLYFYRKIVKESKNFLCTDGLLFFEIGHDQKNALEEMLESADFCDIDCRKDLSGNDRVIVARNK